MSETTLRQALHRAYRQTIYRVRAPGLAFELTIDRFSRELLDFHARQHASVSAFVTAFNPQSRPRDPEFNRANQQRLLARLDEWGRARYPGEGVDPSGEWPAEESVLILDIDFTRACALARDFDQAALVYCGRDCIPRLVVL